MVGGEVGGAHVGEEGEDAREEGAGEEGFEEGVVEECVFGGKRVEECGT